MRLFDMSGKTAIVTGSTKGIGRAIAEALTEAGARVAISSRTAADCETVAAAIRDRGGEAVAVPAHVGRDEELERLVERTREAFGPIDACIANAAVNPYHGPFLETPDDAFRKTFDINVRANLRLAGLVMPEMRERRDGAFVIVSSIAAFKGSDALGLYALTKAADAQMVRNLAVVGGPDNVRVNGIAPALVRTDFAKALWEDEARAKRVADSYALKRLGEPDDIAGVALMLASRAGAWTTGQTIIVDGGWSVAE